MITIALAEDDEAQRAGLSHVVERFSSQNGGEIRRTDAVVGGLFILFLAPLGTRGGFRLRSALCGT